MEILATLITAIIVVCLISYIPLMIGSKRDMDERIEGIKKSTERIKYLNEKLLLDCKQFKEDLERKQKI